MPIVGLAADLSDAMDEVVRGLCEGLPEDVAVLATGGYGQGLLAPYSDVDLLIVSRRRLSASDVRPVLLPLWDADIRVGHAVRTVKETVQAAAADLPTLGAHLTMRHLWGAEAIVDDVTRRLEKVLGSRLDRIEADLLAEERDRRRAAPYRLLVTDLKGGRGGVRSLDLVTWLRRLGVTPPVDPAQVTDARRRIFDLRSAFHLASGRHHDTTDAELRPAAARLLDCDPRDLVRQVVALSDEIEALVEHSVPALGRRGEAPWSPPPQPDDPALAWAVGSAVDGQEAAPPQDAPPSWTPADRESLLWLMTDARGRDGLHALVRTGWMGRHLPEWDRIRLEPHIVPFHAHPVGDHSLRTADALPSCEAWLELPEADRNVLRWAALLHDIGKGTGQDHSIEGARIVERLGTRMRWRRGDTVVVQRLIRHHLDLVETATRKDLSDRRIVTAAARTYGDRRLLRLLAILTEADSKATGTDTWTAWKATLVREAVRRIEAALQDPPGPPGALAGTLSSMTGLHPNAVTRHLAALPDDYRARVEVPEIARDVRLVEAGGGQETRVDVVEETEGHATIAVVAPDRLGLVAAITGVVALANLDVVGAELYTRSDGIACDRFVIGVGTDADRANLRRAVADLQESGSWSPDQERQLAAKAHAYRHQVRADVDPGVRVTGGPVAWEIQLRAADRRGLLHDLAGALADLGVDLRQVRVDTRAGVAYDTLRVNGRLSPEDLGASIRAVLRQPFSG